jgi:hypothetical protein
MSCLRGEGGDFVDTGLKFSQVHFKYLFYIGEPAFSTSFEAAAVVVAQEALVKRPEGTGNFRNTYNLYQNTKPI